MTEQQPEAPVIPGVTRYRVREPVLVDAIRWTGDNEEAVREFAGGHWDGDVPLGCHLVRGITGHFFTVDAGRFAATYEPAGEPLTGAQCDRLRQMVTEHENALSAVRRALDLTAALDDADRRIIAAARAALRVLEGSEEESRGDRS
jgi:hypothetical protein